MADAVLTYLGRGLSLKPAVFGQLFEDLCTVKRTAQEMDFKEQKRSTVPDPVVMYWYDQDNDVFFTYSGYGAAIERELQKRGITVEVRNLVDDGLGEPVLSALDGVSWREGQREVFSNLLAYRGGVIVCPMGFGKSFLIRQLARVYPESTIIVTVPSRDVAGRLFDELQMSLGSEVGFVGDGKNRPRRVTVAVTQSLHKCAKDASLILVDECHSTLTENYAKMFAKFRRARIFGFTASPDGKSDNSDGMAQALFGDVLCEVSYQEAVQNANVVQLKVRLYRSTLGPEVSKVMIKARADRASIWQNRDRNALVAHAVRQAEAEYGPDEQILVMVDAIEHAYALSKLLPEYAIATGEVDAARYQELVDAKLLEPGQQTCSKKDRERYRREFEAGTLKRVIANRIWRQGVDFRDLAVLVRADGTGSTIDARQIPGRLSRLGKERAKEFGLLIDFEDQFSGNLRARSTARISEYRRQGWEILRV